jgi:hypothetical protein
MITRMPSVIAPSLAFDVCSLGAEASSLSLDILRQGFLALDHHGQLDTSRAIKRQLRARLVDAVDAQLPKVVVDTLERALPQQLPRQQRRTHGG